MFGKRQPPPGRKSGSSVARPSIRSLKTSSTAKPTPKPWREPIDVGAHGTSEVGTSASGSVDQNIEQTPDLPIPARSRASPRRATRAGAGSMGIENGALRETSTNGRLAKDLMGAQHAGKPSSVTAGRLATKRGLPAVSVDKSVVKTSAAVPHGATLNKSGVHSRNLGSGPSQKKRQLAVEDGPQPVSTKTRPDVENGHAAPVLGHVPGVTEAAPADVAQKVGTDQRSDREEFQVGSAQGFYCTAGRATSVGEGLRSDERVATWQTSALEAGGAATWQAFGVVPLWPSRSKAQQTVRSPVGNGNSEERSAPLRDVEDAAEVSGAASRTDAPLQPHASPLAKNATPPASVKRRSSDEKHPAPVLTPGGDHASAACIGSSGKAPGGTVSAQQQEEWNESNGGEEASRGESPMERLLQLRREVRELARPQPWSFQEASSHRVGGLELTSIPPPVSHSVGRQAHQVSPHSGEEPRGTPNRASALPDRNETSDYAPASGNGSPDQVDTTTGQGADNSPGSLAGRFMSPHMHQQPTVFSHLSGVSMGTTGRGGASPQGSNRDPSDARIRHVYEEAEQLQKVMGNLKLAEDGLRGDSEGGEHLIEKRIRKIEEEAKRSRDEEWKVELAKLVAEDQELKKMNAKLEAEKRRLEEAVGFTGGVAGGGGGGGGGTRGTPGRKWEVEREVLRVRLWEVEQELSGLKVHSAGLRAEGEVLHRKLELAESAIRKGEQGTQTRLQWYETRLRSAFEETEAHYSAYRSLEEQYRQATDSCGLMEQRVGEHQERCSQWWGEREKAIKEREEEGERRVEAEGRLREVEEEAGRREREGGERVRVAEEQVAKLQAEVVQLTSQLADSHAQAGQLRADLDESRASVERAFVEVESTGNELVEIGAVRKRLNDLTRDREQCGYELEEIRGEVRILRGEVERKGKEVAGQKGVAEEWRRKWEEGERRKEEVESALRVQEGEVEMRGMEVEGLREQLLIETGWKERAEKEVKDLRAMEGEASEEWRKWKGEAVKLEREVGEARRGIQELELRIAKGEGESGGMREVVREKERSCEEALGRLKAKEIELAAANGEVMRLSIEIGTLQHAMERVILEGRRWEETKGKVMEEQEVMEGKILMLEKKVREEEREKGVEVQRWREEAGRERVERERLGRKVEGMEREAGVVEAKMRELEDLNLELEQQWLEAGGEIQILREYLKDKGVMLE